VLALTLTFALTAPVPADIQRAEKERTEKFKKVRADFEKRIAEAPTRGVRENLIAKSEQAASVAKVVTDCARAGRPHPIVGPGNTIDEKIRKDPDTSLLYDMYLHELARAEKFSIPVPLAVPK
jgi:hypothetical protein